YDLDWNHDERWFVDRVRTTLRDSVRVHLRSDVDVGAYLSGGVDSSLMTVLAREASPAAQMQAVGGKVEADEAFDEPRYARAVAEHAGVALHEIPIAAADFVDTMPRVIYHLDYPVAGPGSFPQYMVAQTVRRHLKTVLGGQGGDEVFGGYARYLIAYWE